MARCVIFGAAPTAHSQELHSLLCGDDVFFAADGGRLLAEKLGVSLTLTVSDCDSAPPPTGEYIHLPTQKDDTDTHAVMQAAFDRGYRSFLLLGCLGGRLDHTIANILTARQFAACGCEVTLADEKHEVRVLCAGTHSPCVPNGAYVSYFALTPSVKGLTLHGFAYPLENFTLTNDNPLCISNTVIIPQPTLSFTEGVLLQIISKD